MRVTFVEPESPMIQGALIDPTETYRYLLWRVWDAALPLLGYCMVNPSTADGRDNDPTIVRCMGFGSYWGFGGILVCNLFAGRSTDVDRLWLFDDPVGPYNDDAIALVVASTSRLVMAWGNDDLGSRLTARVFRVKRLLAKSPELGHLGRNRNGRGQPKHPLFLSGSTPFVREVITP